MISLQNLKFLSPHANTNGNSVHEYLNLQMVNEYSENNTLPKLMIFDQTKTSTIIDVADDYFLSVIRWNIQSNLPVLVPDMYLYPPGNTYTARTNYYLSMVYSKTASGITQYYNPSNIDPPEQVLFFLPETIDDTYIANLNAATNKEEVLGNPFYYIKSVDTLLQMMNKAIDSFITNYVPTGRWVHRPYFQWNASAGKIVFNRPNSVPDGVLGTDNTSEWFITVNQPLYNLLNTFRFKHFIKDALQFPVNIPTCRYLLDTNVLQPQQLQTTGDFTQYIQQSSSVVNWSPAQSIVFISSTIPVEPQYAGAPVNLNTTDGTTQSTIYQQQSIVKVLTDFIIPFNTGVEATNSQVFYIPTSEYRLIDLIGTGSLQQLTIQVFWRDKFGSYHPMTLDAGASADIVVLLRKKSFNQQVSN